MNQKLYILDVSGYIFRAYFALPPLKNAAGQPTGALYGFIRSLGKFFKDFAPENIVAVFDGPDNKKQRKEIYEKYKANRVQRYDDLPVQIELAKQFCALYGIPTIEIAGVEADDAMGSIAKWAVGAGYEVYLCTSDKDLCQLVGEKIFVLNTWKENKIIDRQGVEEIYGVPPEMIVDLLAIMGDSSDNIPGVSGFGPKTTVPLLKEFGSLENLLENVDQVKGEAKKKALREEREIAFLSKRLATIYTDLDIPMQELHFAKMNPTLEALREFYLAMGFNSLVKEMQAQGVQTLHEENYHLVDDEHALTSLMTKLKKAKEICFDVESTSLSPLQAKLVGIGFSIKEGEAFYIPLNGTLGRKRVLEALKELFEDATLHFYGQNVKYDIHVLENEGINPPQPSFDTILASYLLHSESRKHSLDHLAIQYFGKIKTPIKELIGSGKKEISMSEVPLEKISNYCCEDVDYTLRLKAVLEKELAQRALLPLLFDLELPLSQVLSKMERNGIYVNVEHLHNMSQEVQKDLEVLKKQIYEMAGEEFNISSPQQLSRILFEKLEIKPLKKTATGLSTRAEVLETLALTYPIAQKIIDFRTLDKLRSTYLETLPSEINPETHRIHPTFNQVVAATGRLSCQDPNLQNIPVRSSVGKKIREGFLPQKKGWSFLAADYSQIELRLLAHLSEDERLIEAFQKGEDIHRYTASLVFNTPYDKVSKQQRHRAKAINFGIVYGQQAFGLSQELGIDIRESASFISAYFERYPKVHRYMEETIDKARKSGKALTMIGREREILEITSANAIQRAAAERLAINTPLQGSAADLIKLAMLDIDRKLSEKAMQSFMILQIHDELIFEAPDVELDELKTLVKTAMEGVFSLKVPLVVDVAVGKNWGEC